MSRRYGQQSADGILEYMAGRGIIQQAYPGAPTNGAVGYATGATYQDLTNGYNYINFGTSASATWIGDAGVDMTGLLATAAELNRSSKLSTREIAAGGAALTVTLALHDGKTVLLDQATGTAVTLPAMTGSGARYRFVVTVTKSGGSDVITATAAHLFGSVTQNTDTANGTSGFTAGVIANAAGITTITLNGTTTGGRKGDWFEIEDVATGIGIVRGNLNASGTEATPFS